MKLLINGTEIGTFKGLTRLLSVAFNDETVRNGVKSVRWNGRTLSVTTMDKGV